MSKKKTTLNATWEQCLPFLLSFCVRCSVCNGLACTTLKYCDYFVLRKSTGAAEHKPAVCRLVLEFERTRRGTSDL